MPTYDGVLRGPGYRSYSGLAQVTPQDFMASKIARLVELQSPGMVVSPPGAPPPRRAVPLAGNPVPPNEDLAEAVEKEWLTNGRCEGYTKVALIDPEWARKMWQALASWGGQSLQSLDKLLGPSDVSNNVLDTLSLSEQCLTYISLIDFLQESKGVNTPILPYDFNDNSKVSEYFDFGNDLNSQHQFTGTISDEKFSEILTDISKASNARALSPLRINISSTMHELAIIYNGSTFDVMDVSTTPGLQRGFRNPKAIVEYVSERLRRNGNGLDIDIKTKDKEPELFQTASEQHRVQAHQEAILDATISDKSGNGLAALKDFNLDLEGQFLDRTEQMESNSNRRLRRSI